MESGKGTLITQKMEPVSSTGENVERDVGRATSNLSLFTCKCGPHVPFFSNVTYVLSILYRLHSSTIEILHDRTDKKKESCMVLSYSLKENTISLLSWLGFLLL